MYQIKSSEPVTLVTDGILFLVGLIISIILLKYYFEIRKKKSKNNRENDIFLWALTYFCLSIFALGGTVHHGTIYISVQNIFRPITVIFGGFTLFFFVNRVIIQIYKIKENKTMKLWILISSAILIIYLILIIIFNWLFAIFGVYLLLVSFFTLMGLRKKIRNIPENQGNIELERSIRKFINILLIAALIQTIGSIIVWEYYPIINGVQYLIKPHNDIFHVIAIYPMVMLLKSIKSLRKGSNKNLGKNSEKDLGKD